MGGTETFGFSHSEADAVCMTPQPGGNVTNADIVQECVDVSNALEDHKQKAAALVAALENVNFARLVLRGEVSAAAKELKDWLKDKAHEEFAKLNAGENQKIISKYKAHMSRLLASSGIHAEDLEDATEAVAEKGEALRKALERLKAE